MKDKQESVIAIIKAVHKHIDQVQQELEMALGDTTYESLKKLSQMIQMEGTYHKNFISEMQRRLGEVPLLDLKSHDAVTALVNIQQHLIYFADTMETFIAGQKNDPSFREDIKSIEATSCSEDEKKSQIAQYRINFYGVRAKNVLSQIRLINENYNSLKKSFK